MIFCLLEIIVVVVVGSFFKVKIKAAAIAARSTPTIKAVTREQRHG
jgi:hypothetical protein